MTDPKIIEAAAHEAARAYVDEWTKTQTIFYNNATLVMYKNFIPGFKAGYDKASEDMVPADVVQKLVAFLEVKSKRSSYHWAKGGDYFPSDYANEGQIQCSTEALLEYQTWKARRG